MKLLQFSDSALPIGTFSFSNGLETAAFEGIVHDATSLENYVIAIATQAAYSDGIAALHAFRAIKEYDYQRLCQADNSLLLFKANEESRVMLRRMGKKMAELGLTLFDSRLLQQWVQDIKKEQTPGTFPAAQGFLFALAGLPIESLFASHQYGVANMVLNAALRCVKVSHYDTQQILFRQAKFAEELFHEVKELSLDEMNTFVPQIDILASLHEKGRMRMFMN